MKKMATLLGWVLCFQMVGFSLGLITQDQITSWYLTLNKPQLNPPAIVFPIVWSILYAILAFIGYSLWQERSRPFMTLALGLFTVQMFMNWLWTPLFFYFHSIAFGFMLIVMMVLLTLMIMYITKDRLKFIAVLLIPYVLWLLFAAYLNGSIWMLNGS
ncbi:MAG: TspO/MBR family protein [Legionellaceae bacterium]